MKKFIALLLALVCVFALGSCSNTLDEPVTLSFKGEHEYFAITNGSIVLSDTEEVFNGGDLEITQSGVFEAVASYRILFIGGNYCLLCDHVPLEQGAFYT